MSEYESGTQSQFQFQTFPLRPQLPLTVNLRETNQAMQFNLKLTNAYSSSSVPP